jgi:hypothetical protein
MTVAPFLFSRRWTSITWDAGAEPTLEGLSWHKRKKATMPWSKALAAPAIHHRPWLQAQLTGARYFQQ